ncbi:MAG: F0F1 ATP synthase subunit gamma [Acetobacteraceae bacterium]
MAERLSDIEARIGSVQQLAAVITAMRGIAAARSREARGHLTGIRAYARTISLAIGSALAFLAEDDPRPLSQAGTDGHAIIALCAEQGFAGVFSERVLDAVQRLCTGLPGHRTEILLVGDRGLLVAGQRRITPAWSVPMVAHTGQVASLAGRVADALYERLEDGAISRVTMVHAVPEPSAAPRIMQKVLVPFDFSRFPLSRRAVPPLITLPPTVLLARLAEEYVFAELCEAVMLSFAAENEARMRAMIMARGNVSKTLDELVARSRQLRQAAITDEIMELAGGSAANG